MVGTKLIICFAAFFAGARAFLIGLAFGGGFGVTFGVAASGSGSGAGLVVVRDFFAGRSSPLTWASSSSSALRFVDVFAGAFLVADGPSTDVVAVVVVIFLDAADLAGAR